MRTRTAFQELNLSDDYLFEKVMENEIVLKAVIEKILDIRISRLEIIQPQRMIEIRPEAKGIRLDVFADDAEGNRYSVEMQKWNEYNLNKRGRYYHSMMALDLLEKGEPYRNLRNSCVIFIRLFDPFRQGRHRYTFEQRCLENLEMGLNDGMKTVFLSTKGFQNDTDNDILAFLKYIEESTDEVARASESKLVRLLHQQVKSVKNNQALEAEFMKLLERDERNYERGLEEGIKEGITQGLKRGLDYGIRAMILDNIEADIPKHLIIDKLQKRFEIDRDTAESYYDNIAETKDED